MVYENTGLEKLDVVNRVMEGIPPKYRRDICYKCGDLIKFPMHEVTIGSFGDVTGLSGDECDVSYVNGFGNAEHSKCWTHTDNKKFSENLGNSIKKLDNMWIKPSSQPLRTIKSMAYLFKGFFE